MAKRVPIILALLWPLSAAWGQASTSPGQTLQQDWVALNSSMAHLGKSLADYAAAMAKEQADRDQQAAKIVGDLNDYWKRWCGESPGCATPKK